MGTAHEKDTCLQLPAFARNILYPASAFSAAFALSIAASEFFRTWLRMGFEGFGIGVRNSGRLMIYPAEAAKTGFSRRSRFFFSGWPVF